MLELQKWIHNLTVTAYSSNVMSLMIWSPLDILSYSLEVEFPQGYSCLIIIRGFPCRSAGKESACNVGNVGSVPGSGRSAGEGKGYPLQYSGLEKSMDWLAMGLQRLRHEWAIFTHSLSLLPGCETLPHCIHSPVTLSLLGVLFPLLCTYLSPFHLFFSFKYHLFQPSFSK